MRIAIRSLAILVLLLDILALLIPIITGSGNPPFNGCGSGGSCSLPLPPAFGNRILTNVLLSVVILSSVVIVTLSIALHSRLEHRRWFAVFLILTGLLVLSPAIQLLPRVIEDAALEVMSMLAVVASLIALASTFVGGAATRS